MSAHIEEARIYASALTQTQTQIQNLGPFIVDRRGTTFKFR